MVLTLEQLNLWDVQMKAERRFILGNVDFGWSNQSLKNLLDVGGIGIRNFQMCQLSKTQVEPMSSISST